MADGRTAGRLVTVLATALWLPFAALAGFGLLAAVSSPSLGEWGGPTVVAVIATVAIPLGLLADFRGAPPLVAVMAAGVVLGPALSMAVLCSARHGA